MDKEKLKAIVQAPEEVKEGWSSTQEEIARTVDEALGEIDGDLERG